MPTPHFPILKTCLRLLLEPAISFCLARGLKIQDLLEIAKIEFVKTAEKRLITDRHEVSKSKISAMTGVQRPEVTRLLLTAEPSKDKSLIIRVVGRWSGDRRFLDKKGRAKPLTCEGKGSQFAKLVAAVSTDLNPHTVKFELERLGLIEVRGGTARLNRSEFLSTGDIEQTFRLGAEDAQDLLSAVEENALLKNPLPNLHVRTFYNNVPDSSLQEIREWFLDLGKKIHADCRAFLSKHDKDLNPRISREEGRNRVMMGTFSNISPYEEPINKRNNKDPE